MLMPTTSADIRGKNQKEKERKQPLSWVCRHLMDLEHFLTLLSVAAKTQSPDRTETGALWGLPLGCAIPCGTAANITLHLNSDFFLSSNAQNTDNNPYIYCCLAGAALSTFHMLFHLFVKNTSGGKFCYYHCISHVKTKHQKCGKTSCG